MLRSFVSTRMNKTTNDKRYKLVFIKLLIFLLRKRYFSLLPFALSSLTNPLPPFLYLPTPPCIGISLPEGFDKEAEGEMNEPYIYHWPDGR